MKFRDAMDIVIKSINFIRSRDLSHRRFQALFENNDEHGDLVYYTEVRWTSRGRLLKLFFDLRDEVKFFMEQKGNRWPSWKMNFLSYIAFLADATEHLDQVNTKLQGANQIVSHVRPFSRLCS